MNRFFKALCILLTLCFLFSSCGAPAETTDEEIPETTNEVTEDTSAQTDKESEMPKIDYTEKTLTLKAADGYFKPLGRTFFAGTGLACDWTAAGAEFTLYCKGNVSVNIRSGSKEPSFRIKVDGVVTHETFMVEKGKGDYVIAAELPEGLHTIEIICIVGNGWTKEINSITFTGELVKYEPEDRSFIEIIGDSITSGHGLTTNEGVAALNGAAGYAFRTIERLGVDYSFCSRSGMGICYAKDPTNIFSEVYSLESFKRSASKPYIPTKTPDLVIINLNHNDNETWWDNGQCTDNGDYTMAKFEAAFDDMLRTFEKQYGKDVPILLLRGCMTSPYHKEVVQNRMWELVDTKYNPEGFDIKTLTLTTNRNGDFSHPDAEGAEIQSEELYNFIAENYPELIC